MAELGEYPVDFIMAEIRRRVSVDTADEVERVQIQARDVESDAWDVYRAETEEPTTQALFSQATDRTFDALLGTRREDIRDKRARAGLATHDSLPDELREAIIWTPKERMSGYQFQVEVVVDLSDPADPSEKPLTVNVFYSLRSKELITHGEILRKSLADFEAETRPTGSFPNQPILGAIVTGIYKFERAE